MIFVFVAVATFASSADIGDVTKAVKSWMMRYPESQYADLYKNFFQDAFGPGHILADKDAARLYLDQELQNAVTMEGPLYEYTGADGNYVRLNLSVIRDSLISKDIFFDLFVRSMNGIAFPSPQEWRYNWGRIDEVIDSLGIYLPNMEEDKNLVAKALASGDFAVHHSRSYNQAYSRHYRLIRADIFKDEILPLLFASHPVTGCYWEWMNGNISKSGITKDLEYMKAAGIESAFIFDVGIGVERGPVDYGSEEWIDAVEHACKEAKRLGITLGIHNSPGYTAVGGPWILPEESMKELTWSVSSRPNPVTPKHKRGFYKDLFVMQTSCADEMLALDCRLEKDESAVIVLEAAKPVTGFNIWRGNREKPLDPFDGPRDYAPRLKVELSLDSTHWIDCGLASGMALKNRDIPIYHHIDTIEARYLKLTSNRGTNLERIEVLTAPGSGRTYRRVGYTTNGETVTAAPDAGIGLEVDKLNRRGVEAHFDKFLRPLLSRLREYCGNTLRYIVIDSWEAGGQDWSETLGVDYLKSGAGANFLTGHTADNTDGKKSLFMTEFVMPFKEMIAPFGLILVGEPYGNGDFDRKEYAYALDLPMSEYWARSHYGTIERPYFVSRYGHSAGRYVIGCESFTAYPGDADIPAELGSFAADIDKLCEAGVNYFVLHCVAHQDNDERPLTMGPFGTRFDRLHANVDSVRAITDYMRLRVEQQKSKPSFDYVNEIAGRNVRVRLPHGHLQAKALLICDEIDLEKISPERWEKLDRDGVVLLVLSDIPDQDTLEQIKRQTSKDTEHPEISSLSGKPV